MTKPTDLNWNARTQQWEAKDTTGKVAFSINSGGILIGEGGSRISRIQGFVGSNAALASVVAYGGAVSVGTITNATGLAVADKVFGVRKNTNLQTVPLSVSFYVPTTNTLNIHVFNSGTIAGSLPAGGWDIIAMRTSP